MAEHIGSVYVNVLPDADRFWKDFQAKTNPGATETGRSIGRPLGQGLGDQAGRDARTRIEALLRDMHASATVKVDTTKSEKDVNVLRTLLLTLAPAAVPLAGVAAAGGAALAAMGAAGLLAVKGVKTEMADGTETGIRYAQALATGKDVLAQLEQTAARGALTGFESSVGALTVSLPFLNSTLGESSRVLGDVAAKLAGGIAGGLENFGPIIGKVEGLVDNLAGRFETWATGPGGAKFAETLSDDFDTVVPVLGNLATAATNILAAFAPSGTGALGEIDLFSTVVNEIPVDVLKVGTTAFIAFKAAVATTAGIKAATVALTGFAAAEGTAAAAGTALGLRTAAGGLAAILSRATPYVAAIAAADFATQSLVKTNNSWAQSNNAVKSFVGNVGTELSALAHFDFKAFFTGSDVEKNLNSRDLLNSIDSAVKAAKVIADETDKFAVGPVKEFWESLPTASDNFLALAQSQQAFNTQMAGSSVGVTQAGGAFDDFTSALGSNVQAQQKWLTQGQNTGKMINGVAVYTGTWAEALQESNGDVTAAAELIGAHGQALKDDQAALLDATTRQKRLNDAVTAAATQYKITAGQLDLYASTAGITADELANGTVSVSAFTEAVGRVKAILDTGNTSLLGFVSAVNQFNQSGKTGADVASLIGETLKAYNGDALGYAGALAGSTSAIDAMTSAFKQQHDQLAQQSADQAKAAAAVDTAAGRQTAAQARIAAAQARLDQVRANSKSTTAQIKAAEAGLASAQASSAAAAARYGNAQSAAAKQSALAYSDTERAAIDFTNTTKGLTASIDTQAKGAPALVQQLQAIQDAAMGAAEATYEHEKSLHEASAADDAYNIYVTKTQGALEEQASNLGLTTTQAKALANAYFGMPADVKTKIEQLGTDKVTATLGAILEDLDKLSGGHHFDLYADATQVFDTFRIIGSDFDSLQNHVNALVVHSIGGGRQGTALAEGGPVVGPGTGTSDSIPAWLSNGEFVSTARATSRHYAELMAWNRESGSSPRGYASGGHVQPVNPGPVTVYITQNFTPTEGERASVVGPDAIRRAAESKVW